MYSASVVESALSVCNLDAHIMGQLAKNITYPVLDMTDDASSDQFFDHSPANEALQYTSILLLMSGR